MPHGRAVMVWLVLFAVIVAAAIFGLYTVAYAYFQELEIQQVRNRSALYQTTLTDALERYRHLPLVLSEDPQIAGALFGVNVDRINRRLARIAEDTRVEAVYLMNRDGLTLAASNHADPLTFLGENYGFRPYFQEALAGGRGEFFAIGATTGRPGYFLAEPVRSHIGHIVGVIAVKIDLSPLIETWTVAGETVFVSNPDGVVLLSAEPRLRYRTLVPIAAERMAEIAAERQFALEPLTPLNWEIARDNSVELDGTAYQHVATPISITGWTLHLLSTRSQARERAWLAIITAVIVVALLSALLLYIRAERMRAALLASQSDRRKLEAVNRQLEQAQQDLERTSKLAALGQLSASVTHELGQPISAMRNYLTAEEIAGKTSPLTKSLSPILDRMEGIARQLRFFASPGNEPMRRIDLVAVARNAADLVVHDLQRHAIDLAVTAPDGGVFVTGNELRLEQVIVNLLRNAIAAVRESGERKLEIIVAGNSETAFITVRDTGHGLNGQTIERMQEPFHTTRASGEGMGLGLAISAAIIREHNGILKAATRGDGDVTRSRATAGHGAEFTVTLPVSGKADTP